MTYDARSMKTHKYWLNCSVVWDKRKKPRDVAARLVVEINTALIPFGHSDDLWPPVYRIVHVLVPAPMLATP